jgi:hypothetical protein
MNTNRFAVIVATVAFIILLGAGPALLATTPGPNASSANVQIVKGYVLSIEGDVYSIKDMSGHEVQVHVTADTKMEGGLKVKVGDRVEAQVSPDGHAMLVALQLPEAESAAIPKQPSGSIPR